MAGRQLPDLSGLDAGHPQTAREGEGDSVGRGVGGVVDDPAGLLPEPLAAGSFLGWEVAGGLAQAGRVGQQALLAAGHVERPQACQGVVARSRPEKQDLLAIGSHRHVPGHSKAEAPGARVLPGKGRPAHGLSLP
jgi:hypothetical protein